MAKSSNSRPHNEIINDLLEVAAKVDRAGHSGYARRIITLLDELLNTPATTQGGQS